MLDRDTIRAGENASVILCTPESGRWVLFSVESEVLHTYRVVHVEGTAKLLTLPIRDEHVPNVFLSAITTSGGDALMDVKEIVVPPVRQFLTVDVSPDKGEVLPGGEGTLTVRTRTHDGEPVAAEVALALVDDSVAAIQGDYAGDPRAFFFGERRGSGSARSPVRAAPVREARPRREGDLKDERQTRSDDGFNERSNRHGARDELAMSKTSAMRMQNGAAAPASEAVPSAAWSTTARRRNSPRASPSRPLSPHGLPRDRALETGPVTDAKGEATVREVP